MFPQSSVDRDARDAARIEAKRAMLADRKKRLIDNPKQRLYGIDTQALTAQIATKQQQQQTEQQLESHYSAVQQQTIAAQRALQQAAAEAKRAAAVATQQYNLQQAQYKQQLNAANTVNTNTYQIEFSGEDRLKQQREAQQKQQQAHWLQQQIAAKHSHDAEEKTNDFSDDTAVFNTLDSAQLQRSAQRQYETERIHEYNRIQAIEAQLRGNQAKQAEEQAKLNELHALSQSKLLNEQVQYNPITGQPIVTEFKGFNQAQKQAILAEQQRQVEDKKLRAELEQLNVKRDEYLAQELRKQVLLQQRENERNRVEQLRNVKQVNLQQSVEQKQKLHVLDKQVYTNEVKPEYFTQWGNSAR